MLPTYNTGDLIIAHSQSTYSVGDIAAYRVPKGEIGAGSVVIHRIVGGDPVHGFTFKGDNNSAPDPWHPKQADMVGSLLQQAWHTSRRLQPVACDGGQTPYAQNRASHPRRNTFQIRQDAH